MLFRCYLMAVDNSLMATSKCKIMKSKLKRDVKGPLHEYIDVEEFGEERQPLGE